MTESERKKIRDTLFILAAAVVVASLIFFRSPFAIPDDFILEKDATKIYQRENDTSYARFETQRSAQELADYYRDGLIEKGWTIKEDRQFAQDIHRFVALRDRHLLNVFIGPIILKPSAPPMEPVTIHLFLPTGEIEGFINKN